MPYVVTHDEYLEVAGVPLSTPAWDVVDLSALYDSPELRGEDREVAYHEGVLQLRRMTGIKHAPIPISVGGLFDPEGNAHDDEMSGIRANLDWLKRTIVRPRQNATRTGAITVRHIFADASVRAGDGVIVGPLAPSDVDSGAVLATIDLLIPRGVLRDEDATEVTDTFSGAGGDLVVPHPGSADQYDLSILLEGTAGGVRLSSMTWDPSGGTFLEFNGAVEASGEPTTIDTGLWTAIRNDVNVVGLVEHSGHERWLPLLAGVDNTILVEPTTGSVDVTITHYAPWL